MMKLKRLFILFFLTIFIFQAKKLITAIQMSDIYYIDCDEFFSQEIRCCIKDYINQHLKNKKPNFIYEDLKEKFPSIKSIIIYRKNPDLLTIKIKAFTPLYKVNGNLIFSENKNLLETNIFNIYSINNLEMINNNEKTISKDFLEFVVKIPYQLVREFKIEWLNKNSIHLKNKLDTNFELLINYSSIPDERVIEICKKIKNDNYSEKNNKKIIADLRFTNQIIISQT